MKKILFTLLKYLLIPFSLVYGFAVYVRNKLFDWKLISSVAFTLPVICVGNITVGGTGKSPHVEYLIELLSPLYSIATLSRGYMRRSRGFKIANSQSDSREIGDEPYQYKSKYPNITVCVAEERMTAIPTLLQQKPETEVVLLDDAFQHRTVRAGLNILLTDYERLYTRDYIMPFGLLRESAAGAARAQIIIVTKCPPGLKEDEKEILTREINPAPAQKVFFSSIHYKEIYPLGQIKRSLDADTRILLVTGIANAQPLLLHLESIFSKVFHLGFKDHHYFNFDDLDEINEAFQHIDTDNKIIVTTEKDASRFMLLSDKINDYQLPFYTQPIGIQVLFDEQEKFNAEIISFVQSIIPPLTEEILVE